MPAPTEDQALTALKRVQGLEPEEFERALLEIIGEPTLAVMNALARSLHQNDDDEAIAKKLHLMMFSFLMARVQDLE
ncbi:MAG TPA: hypothetical protein VGO62_11720 [Myxococcota bacterium]|jgi:hypothetical protein